MTELQLPTALVLDFLRGETDLLWNDEDGVIHVTADGSVEHAEPPVLAALAAWAEHQRATGKVLEIGRPLKTRYLWQCGLLSVLAGRPFRGQGLHHYLPPTRVRSQEDLAALLRGVGTRLGLPGSGTMGERSALLHAFSEAVRNVLEHAQARSAWCSASYFPTVDRVTIAVADTGVGVPTTIRRRHGAGLTDEQANRLAVEPMVTGAKSPGANYATRGPADNFGIGLYFLRTVAERTNGLFSLVSGSASVQGVAWTEEVRAASLPRPWQGTVVTMTFRPSAADLAMTATTEAIARGMSTNRKQQPVAWGPPPSGAETVVILPSAEDVIEDKEAARKARDETIIPALARGEAVGVDLSGGQTVTHSFTHALLYAPIQLAGPAAQRLLWVKAKSRQIKDVVRIVGRYALDELDKDEDEVDETPSGS